MTISNEAVEAAAKAVESCHDAWGTWEDVARAALEAAAPLIQAEALEGVADNIDQWIKAGADEPAHPYETSKWLRARAAALRQR